MKQAIKCLVAALAAMSVGVVAFAQVTTSSIAGRVSDELGSLENAVVIALHEPSGTEYHAVSDNSGNYRIHNMRVGGPYIITVDLLGYAQAKADGVVLKLGETFVWDVKLVEESIALDAAVFTANLENAVLNSEKVGTSTNLSSRELTLLPTGSRSVNDMVRLTPQSTGMSFGGRDNRMNNFTVDGAGFNNNFGLNSDLPGGSAGPISYDAIEEISVNIAPYDVRQSRFTGASINAVTKSGTNNVDGSVYTYQKFRGMHGSKVGDVKINTSDLTSQTYGLSIGAPIVKNKLFFFVNAEYAPVTSPGPEFRPSVDGKMDADNGIARTKIEDLKTMKEYLLKTYNYDPGSFGEKGWDSFKDYTYKIMARIDWNINSNHRLMIRYNDVKNSVMSITNGNSTVNDLRDKSSNRMSQYSIAFSNSFYRQDEVVRSIAAELDSKFSEKVSNQLTISHNRIATQRDPMSSMFPMVDIYEDGKKYMAFGYELFSFNNGVFNNTTTVTDNLVINLGNHMVTVGASFEHMFVKNSYIREGTSYYRYESMEDFMTGQLPTGIGITYGYNGEDAPGQMLTFAQASAYAQDEWNISERFKLTYGVRFELPFYLDKNMVMNNVIYTIALRNRYAGGMWNTATWPRNRLSVNPRVGFNWDVKGDRSLQVRGGTGLFTGVNPFVWFTNQVGGAAFVQSPEMAILKDDLPEGFKFYPNYKDMLAAYPDLFPQQPDQNYLANGASICLVDKNFKFPLIWRSNVAVDVKLPWNMVFTGELLFSKDIYGVRQVNVNQAMHSGRMAGADNRYVWDGSNVLDQTGTVANAMLFTNTNKGRSFQATAQLTKNFSHGFTGMIAYTYSNVKDITSNPGSAANSAWTSNVAVNSLNEEELGYSTFAVPHRVIANLSYRVNYARCLSTTFSLFYQGAHNGRISYTYNGDVNGDGQASDLMYVPKDASEITFVDIVTEKNGVETVVATAAQQSEAFFDYINSNPYLKKRKGDYAERFGGLRKWVNGIDFKVLQDIYTNFGTKNRYSLQLSLDILNVANLLNSNWGCYYTSNAMNYDNFSILEVASKGTTEKAPTYTLNVGDTKNIEAGKGVEQFKKMTSWSKAPVAGNCWSMLFGVRLTF